MEQDDINIAAAGSGCFPLCRLHSWFFTLILCWRKEDRCGRSEGAGAGGDGGSTGHVEAGTLELLGQQLTETL